MRNGVGCEDGCDDNYAFGCIDFMRYIQNRNRGDLIGGRPGEGTDQMPGSSTWSVYISNLFYALLPSIVNDTT